MHLIEKRKWIAISFLFYTFFDGNLKLKAAIIISGTLEKRYRAFASKRSRNAVRPRMVRNREEVSFLPLKNELTAISIIVSNQKHWRMVSAAD